MNYMSQERLNRVDALQVRKELTEQLELHAVCNDFVDSIELTRKTLHCFKRRKSFKVKV